LRKIRGILFFLPWIIFISHTCSLYYFYLSQVLFGFVFNLNIK
jgi:hypothetical protein